MTPTRRRWMIVVTVAFILSILWMGQQRCERTSANPSVCVD